MGLNTNRMEKLEYTLHLWKEKPKDFDSPGSPDMRVYVKNSPRIPLVGELIEATDCYEIFRVFDVSNPIGGGLTGILMEDEKGIEKITKRDISKLRIQDVIIMAYWRNNDESN